MFYDDRTADDVVAISLITGYLGSGKTTLLNRLLQHPEIEETAVLINEFGEIGLDHLLVAELSDDVVLLSSGCICCTVQGELVDSLKGLYMKRLAGQVPKFKRVIIETTGLADPIPIITCLMKDPLFKHSYRLESLVTTVDAIYGDRQLDAHAEAVKQAAVADRIIITKTDLATETSVGELRHRLARLNPGAVIMSAQHGQISPDRLFDASLYDPRSKTIEVQRWLNEEAYDSGHGGTDDGHDPGPGAHDGHDHGNIDVNRHDDRIVSFCITLDQPVDWLAFLDWYEDLANEKGEHLLRVKGIVNVAGRQEPYVINCVQATRHTPIRLPAWPDDDHRSRIVFITQDLPRSAVEPSLLKTLAAAENGSAGRAVGPRRATDGTSPAASRWLNDGEVSRIFGALTSHGEHPAANLIRLTLLLGTCPVDMCRARWGHFDLDRAVWRKPSPGAMQDQVRRVRLSSPALSLLRHMRSRDPEGEGLFSAVPGDGSPADATDIWRQAADAAGLDNMPLDAIAPTFAGHLFDGLDADVTHRLLGIS
jgi:G3E family GTPase